MGHSICGSLGCAAVVERLRVEVGGTPVALDAGIVWLPWPGRRINVLDEESSSEHEYLTPELGAAHAAASGDDGVAFFETRYFGGLGGQVATAWRRGAIVVDRGRVNDGSAPSV